MGITKKVLAFGAAIAALVSLGACSNQGDSSTSTDNTKPTTVDLSKASGTINFWGWDSGNSMKQIIAAFNKDYPNVKVNFNNTGTAQDTSTALQNAISAGKGVPDVVMLEDPTVQQFAITKGLTDLTKFGAASLKADFAPGQWAKLQYNNAPYALPIDSGPEMFFYNKKIFDKAGISAPPKTWDEYYQDAVKIKAIGSYITNNAGDSNAYQPFTAQSWLAGAQPWKVDGTTLTINMTNDTGMKKYIAFQQKLIDNKLIDTKTANWSDAWNRGLNDGSIASLTIGGWMPIDLESGAPDQKGNWRVAPVPQWNEGDQLGAEDGGSSLAVTVASKNQTAAYAFVKWMTHEKGAQMMADTGTLPSLLSILNSDAFQNQTNAYFGGQKVNQMLAQAANEKVTTYQYLPYNPYAQSSFGDTIGKAYTGQESLTQAFKDYQTALVNYGKQQGYTVISK
jgi:multiple sugar transport system substrate-binding protein